MKYRGFCKGYNKWVYGPLVSEEKFELLNDKVYSIDPFSISWKTNYKDILGCNIFIDDIIIVYSIL